MIPRIHRFLLLCVFAASCGAPISRPPLKGKLVKRDFLEEGMLERRDYGAYSYILFARSPATDERYRAILKAFLESLPQDSHQSGVALEQVNLTYVPVLATTGERTLDWLVQNYDVERAATLLHNECLMGAGPYIVTVTEPLTSRAPRNCSAERRGEVHLIAIDLSNTMAAAMPAWLAYFGRISDEEASGWSRRTLEHVFLKVHDNLGQLGHGVSDVVEALPGGAWIDHIIG